MFVEDADDEAFYRSLLRYATQETVRIARVFGLGGRDAVLRHASENTTADRRTLHIVDGDFGWVRGEPPPKIPFLYRLEAYCVENLLLCEAAIARVVSEEAALDVADSTSRLRYQDWLARIVPPLISLAAAYAVLNRVDPEQRTISNGIGRLCTQVGRQTRLDVLKVRLEARRALGLAAQVVGGRAALSEYRLVRRHIDSHARPQYAVSGKTFLLPLLRFHIAKLDAPVKERSLRMRLATNGDPARFAALADALKRAARG